MPAFERVRREFMRRLDQAPTTSSPTSRNNECFANEPTIVIDGEEEAGHRTSEFMGYFLGLGFSLAEIETLVESLGRTKDEEEAPITYLLREVKAFLDALVAKIDTQSPARPSRRDVQRVKVTNEEFPWPLIDMAEFGNTSSTLLHNIDVISPVIMHRIRSS